MALLEVRGIDTFYGRVQALRSLTLSLDAGEIVALIGSNGAGKTTTLRTISGLLHPVAGTIEFDSKDITSTPAHEIVRRGICQSPEGRRLFARMQVIDNLRMGAYTRNDALGISEDLTRVYDLFPRLKERSTQFAGTLSGGEQQMLAIARALVIDPKVMLLDEPSQGLAPKIVAELSKLIRQLAQEGMTILLVEQNLRLSEAVGDRILVMQRGQIVHDGSGDEFRADGEEIRRKWLTA